MSRKKIRVLVLYRTPLLGSGIEALLKDVEWARVFLCAVSGQSLCDIVERVDPSVIILEGADEGHSLLALAPLLAQKKERTILHLGLLSTTVQVLSIQSAGAESEGGLVGLIEQVAARAQLPGGPQPRRRRALTPLESFVA